MKTHKLIIIFSVFLTCELYADRDATRAKIFRNLAMTRSWELGIWRVKNEQANGKEKVYFKLSMTAEAFRYWLLVKDNIIDKNSVYENQVRKSFSNGDLDVSTLKNPLHTDLDGCGGFGVGLILTAEKYQQLSQEFEKFFLSN